MKKNIEDLLDCQGEIEFHLNITNSFLKDAKDMLRKMEEK